MGMSTHVVGIRQPDALWYKHKAVWDACVAANVQVPQITLEFFGGTSPDPAGISVPVPIRAWAADMQEGFEIDVSEIPSSVITLRFYNSW